MCLRRRQLAGNAIHDAKRSERLARGRDERRRGIEPDTGRPGDERTCSEPLVPGGVVDDEDVRLAYGPVAERELPRRFHRLESHARFRPLPLLVDEGDQCDRGSAQTHREAGEIVEDLLGGGIEDGIPAKRRQAVLFARRTRSAAFLATHLHPAPGAANGTRPEHRAAIPFGLMVWLSASARSP